MAFCSNGVEGIQLSSSRTLHKKPTQSPTTNHPLTPTSSIQTTPLLETHHSINFCSLKKLYPSNKIYFFFFVEGKNTKGSNPLATGSIDKNNQVRFLKLAKLSEKTKNQKKHKDTKIRIKSFIGNSDNEKNVILIGFVVKNPVGKTFVTQTQNLGRGKGSTLARFGK